MKFLQSRFEEYIIAQEKNNLHPELEGIARPRVGVGEGLGVHGVVDAVHAHGQRLRAGRAARRGARDADDAVEGAEVRDRGAHCAADVDLVGAARGVAEAGARDGEPCAAAQPSRQGLNACD